MSVNKPAGSTWLDGWTKLHAVSLWGTADLRDILTPKDENQKQFPRAISMAFAMNPGIMAGISNGPSQAYAEEYVRINDHINEISGQLAAEIRSRGFGSKPVAASMRWDETNFAGEFPHKTAATRAGLGWVGRHCQLITRKFGSWVRLGTVLTDMELACCPPVEKNFCGSCTKCVDACPAHALTGRPWHPGLPREEMLDASACDKWKKNIFLPVTGGITVASALQCVPTP